MKNILIIGATSSIARAIAMEFAQQGNNLYLASRDAEELARLTADLTIRYPIKISYQLLDVAAINSHPAFWQNLLTELPQLDGVIFATGYLGDPLQKTSLAEQQKIIATNFTGAISLLTPCANYFAQQRSGFIVALSSVAGDRGRQSNYTYGAAKGALNLYLQGLRNQFFNSNVHVLTVKLGFVDTAMTFGLPGLFFMATPQVIAKKIMLALAKKHHVVYLPKFWRYIMLIIKSIPEFIFKRLKL